MSDTRLIERLTEEVGDVPSEVPVQRIVQHTRDDLLERTHEFLRDLSEVTEIPWGRAEWEEGEDRTVVWLTEGARVVVHHPSGAMIMKTGLDPMSAPFERTLERSDLEAQLVELADVLSIQRWAGENGQIGFERLWQLKAAAANREGKVIDPVLFRAVGAFRHHVADLPVLGPASAVLIVAGNKSIDSVSIHVRPTMRETVDAVPVLSPDEGAKAIARQLGVLMGQSDVSLDEVAEPGWMQFGYLSLPKRKSQQLLEPVYVAQIDIKGEHAQGYVLVSHGSEMVHEPIVDRGESFPLRPSRRQPSFTT